MDRTHSGYRVLIADGDPSVHEQLSRVFAQEGFQTVSAYDGEEALKLFRRSNPDIIILDVIMPERDGLMVCREIRRESDVPVIMLSAKAEEFDRLLGLELGADDYMVKPFSPREVAAKIKAILRRVHASAEKTRSAHLVKGNLDIDMSAFIVRINGKAVPCTSKEIEILYTLADNPGIVFSREHILQSIWGYDYLGDTRAVDSHIKRIRAKLCTPENRNDWDIRTVWGVGYRFEMLTNE